MLQNQTAPRSRKTTLALSAIVVSLLAASTAFAGQSTSHMSVGLTITGPSAPTPASAQTAAPTNRIEKAAVKRDRTTPIVVTHY